MAAICIETDAPSWLAQSPMFAYYDQASAEEQQIMQDLEKLTSDCYWYKPKNQMFMHVRLRAVVRDIKAQGKQ